MEKDADSPNTVDAKRDVPSGSILSPHRVERDHGLRLLARLIARAHVGSSTQVQADTDDGALEVVDLSAPQDSPPNPSRH